MRLARFQPRDFPRESPEFSPVVWGVVDGDWVRELKAPPFDGVEFGNSRHPLADVRLCSPVKPGKVVAIGLTYREHIREMGHDMPEEPMIFRSEEHTSELQSHSFISYAVFCLKKKKINT